jgi:hypothetical protein
MRGIERELEGLHAHDRQAIKGRLHLEWARWISKALKDGTVPNGASVEVQLIRIGEEIALFAVPGELFVEVGLKLKRKMGIRRAFVIAYANGLVGYLPSKRAEAWGWCAHDQTYRFFHMPANFSGGIEDALLNALERMMFGEGNGDE